MSDVCYCCKEEIFGAFCNWQGEPFGAGNGRSRVICHCCMVAVKPQVTVVNETTIELIGTYDNGIRSLKEMMGDGFNKDESIKSIKALGKLLGISNKEIKEQLKIK